MLYRILTLASILLFAVGFVSFGSAQKEGGKDKKGTAKSTTVTVKMIDDDYDPTPKTIKVGDSVIWDNAGSKTHTATSDDPKGFKTGDVKAGDKSKPIVFSQPGDFPYHCDHHSKMKGRIVVEGPQKSKAATVTIVDNDYEPKELKLKAGQSVVWDNTGAVTHTATSDDPKGFKTGDIKAGERSKAILFTKPGEFSYHCDFHNKMKGKIVVEASAKKKGG